MGLYNGGGMAIITVTPILILFFKFQDFIAIWVLRSATIYCFTIYFEFLWWVLDRDQLSPYIL